MAAAIFGIEELMLNEPEAKEYSDAVMDVSRFYVPQFDPKKVAIANLLTCMGGIYTTRIMAYRHRMGVERKNKLRVMPGGAPPEQPPVQQSAPNVGLAMNPPIIGGGDF